MPIKKVGFDSNHLHFDVDIRLRSKPEAAKILRGITGKKILSAFPEIKVEEINNTFGLEVCLTTNAKTREEGLALFRALGFPFKKEEKK